MIPPAVEQETDVTKDRQLEPEEDVLAAAVRVAGNPDLDDDETDAELEGLVEHARRNGP